jgi:hypothetical protein
MQKLTHTLIGLSFIVLTTHAQIVNIPDTNFKAALIAAGIDTSGDGEIQVGEAQAVGSLDVSSKSISDLTGIEVFVSLTYIDCHNNNLTSLDVSSNTVLTELDCYNNKLTSIDVINNTALETLLCSSNQLTNLDVSKNINLAWLSCAENQLASIDITKNTALIHLHCYNNQLTTLDINKNTALSTLYCYNNLITNIDFSENTALYDLDCSVNQLMNIDVSKNIILVSLVCCDNQLVSLDVRNNTDLVYLNCFNNSNLSEICVNNTQLGLTISAPGNWFKDNAATWSTTCADLIEENILKTQIPKLIHIYNIMGQEVNPEKAENGIFIYQYNDCTIKKIGKWTQY